MGMDLGQRAMLLMILFSACVSASVAICDIVARQGDDDKMC